MPARIRVNDTKLDGDYTVPGLMNGIFGTAKWMGAGGARDQRGEGGGGAGEWGEGWTAEEGPS